MRVAIGSPECQRPGWSQPPRSSHQQDTYIPYKYTDILPRSKCDKSLTARNRGLVYVWSICCCLVATRMQKLLQCPFPEYLSNRPFSFFSQGIPRSLLGFWTRCRKNGCTLDKPYTHTEVGVIQEFERSRSPRALPFGKVPRGVWFPL